jgi:hypothetical protein
VSNLTQRGAESGTPRDSKSGAGYHLMSVTGMMEEVSRKHKDLERFGPPERNTLHPLLMYYRVYVLAGMSCKSFTR